MSNLAIFSQKAAKKTTIGAFATLLLLSSSSFSLAIDASEVVERFVALNKTQGQILSFGTIEDDNGDSFNLKGVNLTYPDIKPITVSNIQFNGVVENSDGSVTIGSVVYENISFTNENVVVTMEEVAAKNYALPSKETPDPITTFVYFSNMSGKNLKVMADGKPVGGMATLSVDYGEIVKDQPITMHGDASGISIDVSGVEDAKFKKGISSLGYDGKFSGNMVLDGTWNPTDGRMDISKYDLKFDNVGTLSMLFTLNGYTAERLFSAFRIVLELSETSRNIWSASSCFLFSF